MMIETEYAGMLSSALDDMEYADILQWEGSDRKQPEKRKRPTSDRETIEHHPLPKHPVLQPVSRGDQGRAIPEEVLGDPNQTTTLNPTDLREKKKRRRPRDREPIRMIKGQPVFKTMETLRDTEVRGLTYGQLFLLALATIQEVSYRPVQEWPPRKKKGKIAVLPEKTTALAEPVPYSSES